MNAAPMSEKTEHTRSVISIENIWPSVKVGIVKSTKVHFALYVVVK